MTLTAAQGWVLIIVAVFGGITSLLTLIYQQRNNTRTILQRNRVEEAVKVVSADNKIIRANTNATLGESLRVSMVTAQLLHAHTKLPEHQKRMEEAERAYMNHARQMADAETAQTDTENG